jgi:small subunit ribosomal protein S9
MAKKTKVIQTSGTRKTAIARLTLRQGTGIIRVNSVLLNNLSPKMARMKIEEVCIFGSNVLPSCDIDIKVSGGGVVSQAEAARIAIGKALVIKDDKIKETLLSYDRQLLIADTRYKETAKPNCHGSARAKRQKSYR